MANAWDFIAALLTERETQLVEQLQWIDSARSALEQIPREGGALQKTNGAGPPMRSRAKPGRRQNLLENVVAALSATEPRFPREVRHAMVERGQLFDDDRAAGQAISRILNLLADDGRVIAHPMGGWMLRSDGGAVTPRGPKDGFRRTLLQIMREGKTARRAIEIADTILERNVVPNAEPHLVRVRTTVALSEMKHTGLVNNGPEGWFLTERGQAALEAVPSA